MPGTVLREKSLKLSQYLACLPMQKSLSPRFHFSNLYFPRKLSISSSYSDLFEESSVKNYFTNFWVFCLHGKFSVVFLCMYTSFFIHSHFFTHLIRQLGVTYSVSPAFLNKLLGLLPNSAVFLFSKKPISVLI